MRNLLIAASALGLIGSAALADEVVVQPAGPGPIIEHRAAHEDTTTTRTVRHGDGCASHSVTHTNDDTGSSVTHTRTNC